MPSDLPSGSRLAVGDIDGDLRDEIVLADPSGAITIRNQFGVVTARFQAAITPSLQPVGPLLEPNFDLATADVDGNGSDEIVVVESLCHPSETTGCTQSAAVSVYEASGTEIARFQDSFVSPVSYDPGDGLASGDVDGNGVDEIIIAHSVNVSPGGASGPQSAIVAIYAASGVRTGVFADTAASAVPFDPGDAVAVGDVDGNGHEEIIIAHSINISHGGASGSQSAGIGIYTVSGTRIGWFADSPSTPVPFDPGDGLAVGDIDGGGAAEIVIAHSLAPTASVPSANVQVYKGSGVRIAAFSHTPSARVVFDPGDSIAVGIEIGDRDGDSLLDAWETLGIDYDSDGTVDLDLPVLGASADHKDIFVEMDAFDCRVTGSDCGPSGPAIHNHIPPLPARRRVALAFASAPVANPDGRPGINLHLQLDETLPHANECDLDCLSDTKRLRFGTSAERANSAAISAKRLVYHYSLWAHSHDGGGSSGIAELNGDDFIVSLGDSVVTWPLADYRNWATGTLMHELGHNLGLRHGGDDAINCKPNYLSVMNYAFQREGLLPTSLWDYSRAALPAAKNGVLDEGALDESVGIGDGPLQTRFAPAPGATRAIGAGSGPINWDHDAHPAETLAEADINNLGAHDCGPSPWQKLRGFDDWSNLNLNFRANAASLDGAHPTLVADEMTNQTAEQLRLSLPPRQRVPVWQHGPGDTLMGFAAPSNVGANRSLGRLTTAFLDLQSLALGDITEQQERVPAGTVCEQTSPSVAALRFSGTRLVVDDAQNPTVKGCTDVPPLHGRVFGLFSGSVSMDLSQFAGRGNRVVGVSALMNNCGGTATFSVNERAAGTPSAQLDVPKSESSVVQSLGGTDIVGVRFEGQELSVGSIGIQVRCARVPGPNTVVADDFIADGNAIKSVRFWGAFLDEDFVPPALGGPQGDGKDIDGWLIGFHTEQPAPASTPGAHGQPGTDLGQFFCPPAEIGLRDVGLTECGPNGRRVIEHMVDLENCWAAVAAKPDPRDLGSVAVQPPVLANAFIGTPGRRYWLSIQAVAGFGYDLETGRRVTTINGAQDHFWGWFTHPDIAADRSVSGTSGLGTDGDAGWSYGDWQPIDGGLCPAGDQTLELFTTTLPEN
ncbi:hypothetical protein DEA8626_02339 [Defluviimonas aquaemixtae]|uniref:DUF7901 domain-containing protein n=2 Tax=Albidovulum aquaemixtae TaxID=1542388 RepID=A0A2R8B886_9RHOB|nr:hypothetical protein DEA8626_02339 [Defluviimonas aquaemixtae]